MDYLGIPEDFSLDFGDFDTTTEQQPSGAIELSGEDLDRFRFRLRSALANAKSQMNDLHDDARRDRKIYKALPKKPAYEGGPDITSPLSGDRADGMIAHLRAAIEQRPFATFTPEGVAGKSAEDATAVAPVFESYCEREINKSGSREILASEAVREAVITGTAIVKLGISYHGNEHFIQASKTIRLENFYVDRVSTSSLRNVFCAYRTKMRHYELEDLAAQGYLDEEVVKRMGVLGSGSTALIEEEHEERFNEGNAFEEENRLHEIYYCYMRFRKAGDTQSRIYECIYSESSYEVLALRVNPVGQAYDEPPIALIRIGKQSNYLFGRGIVRRLESEQKISDNAINTHIAINNRAAAPNLIYNINSPIAQKLQQESMLPPGASLPSYGPPDTNDYMFLQTPNPGLALQDYGLASQMAERRTYPDEAIGHSGTTRKTLGQYRSEVNKGTLKLNLDLVDFSYDMANLLKKYWSMVVTYKIEPAGLVSVQNGGKLIASREIPYYQIATDVVEVGQQMIQAGEMQSVEDLLAIEPAIKELLTNNKIPSARRADLTISLTGTQIFSDKLGELDTELRILGVVENMRELAAQDSYANYTVRQILTKAGFKDIDKRIPPDPNTTITDPTIRMFLMQNLNQFMQSSSAQF